jgi:predicted regulator of Ras-like GTPase activity (Roadblock/LC7/MglB family)
MSRAVKASSYTLRSGVTIYPSQNEAIDKVLLNLLKKAPARFLLLTDVTGQIVSARGEQGKIDLVALGSLVAGDLAASQEIARLTGEYQDHQMVLREGQTVHTFISEAGHFLALLVQVSNEVPLGWARMLIKKSAEELAEVMEHKTPEETEWTKKASEELEPVLSDEGLSDLFSEALDDLLL